MEAGWGFHVSLEALAKSAYVWQHLRTFRLVRARHAAELGTKNMVNLASLPQEIIDIIEDELALSAYDLIKAKEPFHFPCIDCDAFWNELYDSKQYNDAQERFQASYIRDNLPKSIDADEALDSDDELYYDLAEQAFEAFSDTTEHDQLCEAFMPIHQFENGCDMYFEKHHGFWDEVGICMSSPEPPKRAEQEVMPILEAIYQFARDFGLSVIPLPACNYDTCYRCYDLWESFDRMSLVSLTFRDLGGHTVKKVSKGTCLNSAQFDTVRFSRFIRLFHFIAEGYILNRFPYLETRWLVYRTSGRCCEEPIRLQMTLEEVEAYKARESAKVESSLHKRVRSA